MIPVTYLPAFVLSLFQGMPGVWKSHHRLVLCWLLTMQALFPGRKTLAELARWTPKDVTVWRLRRLLRATYWDVHRLVEWWAQQPLTLLPPPEDGVLMLISVMAVTNPNAGSTIPSYRQDGQVRMIPGCLASALPSS